MYTHTHTNALANATTGQLTKQRPVATESRPQGKPIDKDSFDCPMHCKEHASVHLLFLGVFVWRWSFNAGPVLLGTARNRRWFPTHDKLFTDSLLQSLGLGSECRHKNNTVHYTLSFISTVESLDRTQCRPSSASESLVQFTVGRFTLPFILPFNKLTSSAQIVQSVMRFFFRPISIDSL